MAAVVVVAVVAVVTLVVVVVVVAVVVVVVVVVQEANVYQYSSPLSAQQVPHQTRPDPAGSPCRPSPLQSSRAHLPFLEPYPRQY